MLFKDIFFVFSFFIFVAILPHIVRVLCVLFIFICLVYHWTFISLLFSLILFSSSQFFFYYFACAHVFTIFLHRNKLSRSAAYLLAFIILWQQIYSNINYSLSLLNFIYIFSYIIFFLFWFLWFLSLFGGTLHRWSVHFCYRHLHIIVVCIYQFRFQFSVYRKKKSSEMVSRVSIVLFHFYSCPFNCMCAPNELTWNIMKQVDSWVNM